MPIKPPSRSVIQPGRLPMPSILGLHPDPHRSKHGYGNLWQNHGTNPAKAGPDIDPDFICIDALKKSRSAFGCFKIAASYPAESFPGIMKLSYHSVRPDFYISLCFCKYLYKQQSRRVPARLLLASKSGSFERDLPLRNPRTISKLNFVTDFESKNPVYCSIFSTESTV
jgi:hypothetical protein